MHEKMFQHIGLYFVHWSSFELAVDIGISKLGRLSATKSLEKTRRLTVSEKVKELRRLTIASKHPHQTEIVDVLDRLPKESLRNVIAHCYMRFGANRVIFVQRKSKTTLLRFDMSGDDFSNHLREMSSLAHALSEFLGNTDSEAEEHFNAR
jgi:hypothetical protein